MKANTGKRIASIIIALLLAFSLPANVFAAQQEHIKIILNTQNGTGGDAEIYVVPGGSLPRVTPPVRRGYMFQGYYAAASGIGEQYYDSTGTPQKNCDFTATAALYAYWQVCTYSITYENMEEATFGTKAPLKHTFGIHTAVSNPTKSGYRFFGWQVNSSPVASQSLTLGAAAYDEDITLTAIWNKATLVTLVDNATETVTMLDDDLRQVFQRQVTDPATGVTADDLNSEKVLLTLFATNADNQAEGAADILGLAQGEVLKFYDFSVTKTVTKQNENPIVSSLHELPNTVQVEIALGPELRGRSSYRVYRYHNNNAEAIPLGPTDDAFQLKESFTLSTDGSTLILHTRRLSTYAVVGGEKTMSGTGNVENNETGLDVQAQVLDGGEGPAYKVDIIWGPMRFSYSTGREWDVDEHRYTDVRIYDWIPDVCYTGGNNQITVRNHSNADVSVGFTVFPKLKNEADMSLLDGVDMVINSANTPNAPPASKVLLPKVPNEGAEAPSVSGFLRLNGSPTDPEFYKGLSTDADGYVQVADIAVTIAHMDDPRTPKDNA